MTAPTKRTAVLTRYGRKDDLMARYGTMKNVYEVLRPMLEPAVPTAYLLGQILENEPARPDQVEAVEQALDVFVEGVSAIADRMLDAAMAGKPITLSIDEVMALRDALRLSESDSDEGGR